MFWKKEWQNLRQSFEFLNELLEKATPLLKKEIEELKSLAKADGIEEMQSYDHAFTPKTPQSKI